MSCRGKIGMRVEAGRESNSRDCPTEIGMVGNYALGKLAVSSVEQINLPQASLSTDKQTDQQTTVPLLCMYAEQLFTLAANIMNERTCISPENMYQLPLV